MPREVSDIGYTQLTPAFFDLQTKIDRYLPRSAERAWVLLQSSSLWLVTGSSLRALPYAAPGGVAKVLKINDLFHFLSTRLGYLETGLMVAASLAFNCAAATFYTVGALATLGVSRRINYSCRMHWGHTGFGMMALLISVSGVVYPLLGIALNKWFVVASLYSIKGSYKGDLKLFEKAFIHEVKDLYSNYETLLRDLARNKAGDRYDGEFRPAFTHIAKRMEVLENMDDLLDLIADIWKKFPKMGLYERSQEPSSSWLKWWASPAAHAHYE